MIVSRSLFSEIHVQLLKTKQIKVNLEAPHSFLSLTGGCKEVQTSFIQLE